MKKLANHSKDKLSRYLRRKHRTNTVAKAVSLRPRVIVKRSNKYIYVQLIDQNGSCLVDANDVAITAGTKSERAFAVGKELAEKAKKQGVEEVTFDRNGFLFHGRVKQLAEGAREGGLVF